MTGQSIVEPFLASLRGFGGDRVGVVEAALKTPRGQAWRSHIAPWLTRVVPVEILVPEASQHWRPLVRDAIEFVFSRLSDRRLAVKLVEQIELPAETRAEQRLLRLINQMPGLQKVGQVLARNRRLAPSLRSALSELENGMSDVTPQQVRAIIEEQLGDRLRKYGVKLEPAILKEASVSAVVRFTWRNPDREREQGVFKVLKPYVPDCFAEDMSLLERLGGYLAEEERGYGFAVRDVKEMLAEVRILLEHELDFPREQATLIEAERSYRANIGIRVPRLIAPLCTSVVTAMSAENGVKVTDAFPRSAIRRSRIVVQLIEALIAVPLFSREKEAVFHADPHAGNLLYDEPNRELVVLDWALAERLSLESRRQLVMLALMTILRNREGVCRAIQALSLPGRLGDRAAGRLIELSVARYFDRLPPDRSPGTLDAMMLLDETALEGVHFPAPLFLFRKIVFTLDGVLRDVAGSEVRIDQVIAREFLTRCVSSLGLFHAPLTIRDILALEWNWALYGGAAIPGFSRLLGGFFPRPSAAPTGSGRASHGSTPSRKKKSPRPGKSHRPVLLPQ